VTTALLLLIICATILGVAAGVWDMVRGRRSRAVRALAGEFQMNYSAGDRFHLADRVAGVLPCPGAADVQVSDLLYGGDETSYRYVFTANYTTGVVLTKRRVGQVVRFIEPQQREDGGGGQLTAADREMGVLEQYRELLKTSVVSSQ
jgi:hypothetical protein